MTQGLTMRDDFPQKTKEILARRVGLRCSNPKCRRLTSGPHATSGKSVNVGVAAHVTAASLGGPRYDASLNAKERMSVNNGIWLCQTCAKLVDSDSVKFTKEVLLNWKETAEHLAASEIHRQDAAAVCAEDAHSICFAVDYWRMWRNRGNLPGDSVVVIEGWARGDVRYSGRIRLRNDLPQEDVLHHLRMEFQRGDEVLFSDEYPFPDGDIVLPPGKWVTLEVCYGLHDFSIFEKAKTVWFRAETVGDNDTHRWQVATIDHASVRMPE